MSGFKIEHPGTRLERLVADRPLSGADFNAIAAAAGRPARRAFKVGLVAGRVAKAAETVETKWSSESTTNVAQPGDWVVTNYKIDRTALVDGKGRVNTYVIRNGAFAARYERAPGESNTGLPFFKSSGEIIVDAIGFPGGLDIVADWGERQTMSSGYLLRSGTSVYGNESLSFDGTYKMD